jgi:hypothetical protein
VHVHFICITQTHKAASANPALGTSQKERMYPQ